MATEEMSWEESFDALVEAHIRLPDAELELKANGKKFIKELLYRAGVNASPKAFEAYITCVTPFDIGGDDIDLDTSEMIISKNEANRQAALKNNDAIGAELEHIDDLILKHWLGSGALDIAFKNQSPHIHHAVINAYRAVGWNASPTLVRQDDQRDGPSNVPGIRLQ